MNNKRIKLSNWSEYPFLLKMVFLVNFPFCFVFENNFVLKAGNFRNNLVSPQSHKNSFPIIIKLLFSIKHFPAKGVPVDLIENTSKTQRQSRTAWNEDTDKKCGLKFLIEPCRKCTDHLV